MKIFQNRFVVLYIYLQTSVDYLIEGVLSIGARLAEHDLAGSKR